MAEASTCRIVCRKQSYDDGDRGARDEDHNLQDYRSRFILDITDENQR